MTNKAQITDDAENLYNNLVEVTRSHRSAGTQCDRWRVAFVATEALRLIVRDSVNKQNIEEQELYELAAELAKRATDNK